ncbi:hypothetical protein KDN24_08755 [Bacillus sp. Bva_UNVM-123]|uniref:hypothetical protein n=1 Tax=Bacillus sp. Bva_UNVM-123 TaxID=2829798 RepID=UPI00391FB8F3
MSFFDTKELFLSCRTDSDFYDSSLATYKRKIEVFFEFLTADYGVNENNYKEVLRGIDNIAITKSIEFYVKKYSISFKNTIDLYISAIKSYFEFLNKNLDIRNDNFDSAISFSAIKNSIDNKIIELGLETTELKSPITEQAFTKILNRCDGILNTYTLYFLLENRGKSKKNPVQIFTSAIVTKLVMLTGIKNQVIDTIKLKDYDSELNIITINNFSIHLPNGLGKQMKLYLELRNCIVDNNDENYPLFVKKDGTSIGIAYEYIFKILKDTLGSASAECVAKYTIMQMIKKGMNLYLIKMLTKFGIESCLHCQELVNDEKTNEDITSQNRYIDSKIRSMDVFDLL